MSYLPAARPGMIPSKVSLTMSALIPITAARALLRSASIPITVWPSEAKNSFGAQLASAAPVSVPFDLIAAGTSAATAASAAGTAELVAALDVVAELELAPPALADDD